MDIFLLRHKLNKPTSSFKLIISSFINKLFHRYLFLKINKHDE